MSNTINSAIALGSSNSLGNGGLSGPCPVWLAVGAGILFAVISALSLIMAFKIIQEIRKSQWRSDKTEYVFAGFFSSLGILCILLTYWMGTLL